MQNAEPHEAGALPAAPREAAKTAASAASRVPLQLDIEFIFPSPVRFAATRNRTHSAMRARNG
jgi:hypothetical protein